jgi:hypothetical protein
MMFWHDKTIHSSATVRVSKELSSVLLVLIQSPHTQMWREVLWVLGSVAREGVQITKGS